MPNLHNLEYHLVTDGVYWTDGGGAFGLVPRLAWERRLPPDDHHRIPLILNSLLLRSAGKTILVDTGEGNKLSPAEEEAIGLVRPDGDLLTNLARLGVQPEDIDIVINTHLHADHCAGNTKFQDGAIVPTFPNAQYLIQRLEWADAMAPNERTRTVYLAENYQPLAAAGQLQLIDGGVRVTDEVRTAITRGHTRAHQVVILESGGESAIFMADMATLHYHFERLAWVTTYDVEPLESIETKRYWQQWAIETKALLIFQHDTQIPLGRLHPAGTRFKVEPIAG
jgi:glyoxylase-like metal-dependent hydrolase (beta-lactamase superfamily II)